MSNMWKRVRHPNQSRSIRDRWHSRKARRKRKARLLSLRKLGRKGRKGRY